MLRIAAHHAVPRGAARAVWVLSVRMVSSKPPKSDTASVHDLSVATHKRRMPSSYATDNKDDKLEQIEMGDSARDARGREIADSASKTALQQLFIPIDRFPRAPDHIVNMSAEDLLAKHRIRFGDQPSQKRAPDTYVDFVIPDRYLKSEQAKQITPRDKEIVAELDDLSIADSPEKIAQRLSRAFKLFYDQETDSYHTLPEHALRRSLSGMINLNPNMDDIDDEYLWQLFPKGSLFGTPPFEGAESGTHTFRQWEQEMLEKQRRADEKNQSRLQEYNELQMYLNDTKSFFRKPANSTRKKLDRKLLKEYKKMRGKGKPDDDN